MTPTILPRLSVAFPWLALSLAACAVPPLTDRGACAATTMERAMTFAGENGARARVTRTLAPDGSETLHGETDLALDARTWRCVVEDVRLDAGGRLASADIAVGSSCTAEPESRTHIDPARGVVSVTTGAGTVEQRAPRGTPWIYTPEVLPGRALVTPVAAWVAARAAAAAPALTLVQLERRQAWRVPGDQVAVATELGTTVVLGGDGADVDQGFVQRLRMLDDGVTLVSVPSGEE
jgi:hypothetical protein